MKSHKLVRGYIVMPKPKPKNMEEDTKIKDKYVSSNDVMHVITNTPLSAVWKSELINALCRLPIKDVQEIAHAKWESNNDGIPVCSNCNEEDAISRDDYSFRDKIRDNHSAYCPECGAKMEE